MHIKSFRTYVTLNLVTSPYRLSKLPLSRLNKTVIVCTLAVFLHTVRLLGS